MAISDRNLSVGTKLWARYKGEVYTAEVVLNPNASDESGRPIAYRLTLNGETTDYKSPSAAGSKVMGGKAVNGWRFWSVEGEAPATTSESEARTEKPKSKSRSKGKKQQKVVFKTPQTGARPGKTHFFCSACMKGFDVEGDETPEQCPEGHRNDDPELNAPSGVSATEEAEVTA